MTSSDTTTLPALQQLLSEIYDRAQVEYPALAATSREALMLSRTAYTVYAGANIQLQGAIASLRAGRPDDAVELIERAVEILARWNVAQ